MKTDLDSLLETYLELNKLNAEPGMKCHMLASCIQFIQRQILTELKSNRSPTDNRYELDTIFKDNET